MTDMRRLIDLVEGVEKQKLDEFVATTAMTIAATAFLTRMGLTAALESNFKKKHGQIANLYYVQKKSIDEIAHTFRFWFKSSHETKMKTVAAILLTRQPGALRPEDQHFVRALTDEQLADKREALAKKQRKSGALNSGETPV